MFKTLCALATLAAFTLPSAAQAAGAPGKERTDAMIALFTKVKADDGKLSAADKAANAKVFADLDGFLDFDTLTSKPMAPRADKFNAKEAAQFKEKFRELIRLIAYPRAGKLFQTAKFSFKPEQQKGEAIVVSSIVRFPEEDLETTIEYEWHKVGNTWKIQDLLFDGDSLVKDYQNQISKMVDKNGVAGLMKALDDRRAELNKPAK